MFDFGPEHVAPTRPKPPPNAEAFAMDLHATPTGEPGTLRSVSMVSGLAELGHIRSDAKTID